MQGVQTRREVGTGVALAWLSWLAPNPWALGIVVAGAGLELIALLGRPGGPPFWLVVPFVAWTWLSATWLATAITRLITSRRGRGLRWGLAGLAGILGIGFLAAYAISWGFAARSGIFAGPEALEFAARNATMVGHYLGQVEAERILAAGLLAVVALAVLPTIVRGLARSSWPWPEEPGLTGRRRIAWYALTALWIAALGAILADPSGLRRGRNLDAIRTRLGPGVTLVVGLADLALDAEPPGAPIHPAELVPIQPVSDWLASVQSSEHRPSVLLVAVESLRADVVGRKHQGREVMPNLNRLAKEGIHLTRAYAQSTHSDYSDVCVPSSLYPLRTRRHHYYRADDPWPRTLVYDLLRPLGYGTAIVSSQNEGWGGMDAFLKTPGLDHFDDAQTPGALTRISAIDVGLASEVDAGVLRAGKRDDGATIDAALEWLDNLTPAQPFCLAVNTQDSHFPYELDPAAPRPFQPCEIGPEDNFLDYPDDHTEAVRNAYDNALHETDRQLGRLIEGLERLGRRDDTLLVVYGENGEAFHEHGRVTHGWEPHEAGVHVACVLSAPGWLPPLTDDYPTELIDLAPTVLAQLGLPPHPNFQGIDVLAPNRPPAIDRTLFFHVENPVVRWDALLLGGRWKFHHDRRTGQEWLYDLATDPAESRDLLAADPARAAGLRRLLAAWRSRQLAYYANPALYSRSYPPAPPLNPPARTLP